MNFDDLPGAAWQRLFWLTAGLTVAATLISIGLTWLLMNTLSTGIDSAGLATAIAVPMLIGGPMTFIHLLRLTQLRQANHKLQILASTDWLTSCLNRRAFTTQVTSHLHQSGAFLVIDADRFKDINDHFGHDRGDQVLQLIAKAIRSNVRENDIVGRIGGEEFGVFLRDASLETARVVAERIRSAVHAIHHAAEGERVPLSVSVGGAFYDGGISFSQLFRIADQRLYGVKQTGRNRVDIAHASDHPAINLGPTAFAA